MRILSITEEKDLRRVMQDINVDASGIKIMLPKARVYLFNLKGLSNISANILKQEMLSLGGDVAIARDALTGKAKKTDCLIMGNLSQIGRLSNKLHQQPFGLNRMAGDLKSALKNYQRTSLKLNLGKYKLNLGERSYIMGIVNVTPDSFSKDGIYAQGLSVALEYAQQLIKDGADIIDIGGESSRPGAKPVTLEEELSRTIPLIRSLAKKIKVPISIDTCKPKVAEQALDHGASLVNDITGLRSEGMIKVVSRYKSGVVIMHMQGNPRSMQKKPKYTSVIDEIIECLSERIDKALDCGIDNERIIIDPGIGFGKRVEHNLEILKRLREFKILGRPLMVGTSRKSFIGKILHAQPKERIFGTISSCVLACENGANIVRVHDVKAVKEALLIKDSVSA